MIRQLYTSLDSALAFRELYTGSEPSLSALALLTEWAGSSGVSLSGRQDRMPLFLSEVKRLKEELTIRVNAQLTPELEILRIAFELQPDRVTLIPPRWVGPSVVGGLESHHLPDDLRGQISQLHAADIEVAMQIEPKLELVKRLQRIDCDVVIFSTHALMSSSSGEARRKNFSQIMDATVLASRLGMKVGVSGALDLTSVEQLCRIRQLQEIHVGQNLTGRSILRGIDQSIRDFIAAIERGGQALL